jgi:hypothetical protein
MKILNMNSINSYKTVNNGIFAMNGDMSSDEYNSYVMKTESGDAFRFFIQRRLYGTY